MYTVKLTPYRANLGRIYDRQTEHHSMMSSDGRYRFVIGDEVKDPDFWVVQGKGVRQGETCCVAPENTIVLTTEPASILVYPSKYLKQFGMVCTCQERTKHPNVQLGPAILPWFVGYDERKGHDITATLDYDQLKDLHPKKTKLMSVITSNKAFTQGHIDRIRFVSKLKEHFGDQIDIFGRGFHSFGDKWEVLSNYKYHIVIENSAQTYYWTEKLGDCYLAESYPFYFGCTNLDEFFPNQAYTQIDITHPEEAIRTIEEVIAAETYENSIETLRTCKAACMGQYNMFNYIAMLCDKLDPTLPKREVTIKPCKSSDHPVNLWRYLVARTYYKWKNKVVNRKANL